MMPPSLPRVNLSLTERQPARLEALSQDLTTSFAFPLEPLTTVFDTAQTPATSFTAGSLGLREGLGALEGKQQNLVGALVRRIRKSTRKVIWKHLEKSYSRVHSRPRVVFDGKHPDSSSFKQVNARLSALGSFGVDSDLHIKPSTAATTATLAIPIPRHTLKFDTIIVRD